MKIILKKRRHFLNFRLIKKILVILLIFSQVFYLYQNVDNIDNNIKKIKSNSSVKVCLCLICKNENLYIKEFVDHYKNLGYNHIFIYDNNDIMGEKLEEVIRDEIDSGFISIINYRGLKNQIQFKVYIDCYEKNNKYYDWLSFFDTDEFLELKPKGIKIQEFLGHKRFKICQNIKFNWLLYSDNDKLYYEKSPVQKRFIRPLFHNSLNAHVKSIVRGNLSTNYWEGAFTPHSGTNNYNCCSPSGKKISSISPQIRPYYKYGYLKHYRTKTIEEYINKIKRGRADIDEIDYKEYVEIFFKINKKTKKKIKYFNKELNDSFN